VKESTDSYDIPQRSQIESKASSDGVSVEAVYSALRRIVVVGWSRLVSTDVRTDTLFPRDRHKTTQLLNDLDYAGGSGGGHHRHRCV
jgi:hypothetical protein